MLEKTLLQTCNFLTPGIDIFFFFSPLLLFIVTIINTHTQINENSFANPLGALKSFPSSCFHTMQINVISTYGNPAVCELCREKAFSEQNSFVEVRKKIKNHRSTTKL